MVLGLITPPVGLALFVPVFARHLHGQLAGLGAGIGKEHGISESCVHQLVGQFERDGFAEAQAFAAGLLVGCRDARIDQLLDERRLLADLSIHTVVDPVEDARDREEDGGLHFFEVVKGHTEMLDYNAKLIK